MCSSDLFLSNNLIEIFIFTFIIIIFALNINEI